MATTHAVLISKRHVIMSWIFRVLLAVAFFGSAVAKLVGVSMMVQIFDQIGLGQGFRYITAIVEIVGAIGLFIPGATAFAALWLATTMFFALLTHIFILHSNPTGAVVLLVLAVVLAWFHREQVAVARKRLL